MFLGIDCGTQSTKAVLFDENGIAHGTGHAAHELVEKENGAREQQPSWWIDAMIAAVRSALAEEATPPEAVHAIGVSGQQHGLVVLDENMQVIRAAKLWNDTETAPQNEALLNQLGGSQAWFDQTGIVPLTGYTLSKLLWLKQNEPENFARVRHILLPHDYLNFWLTGQLTAEFGDASGTAFFDTRTRTWAEAPLTAIDGGTGQLRNALPRLIQPDELAGHLRPEAATALGLTTACVVSAGGGDNMMGAIGTGNVTEGIATISLGTSSTVYSYSSTPVGDPKGQIAAFCSSTGGWLPLVCTMNSTNVTTDVLRLLGRDVPFLSQALAATHPGADGITFIPFLNGERTPDLPTARGSLFGVSSSNLTPENFMRAAVEGVTFGILSGLNLITQSRKPQEIVLIGGGAKSGQWRQLIADATGATIRIPQTTEAGCLGAAIQAMWAWSKHNGTPQTITTLTRRCVKLDNTKTASPDTAKHALYQTAITRYHQHLHHQYGV